MLRFFQGELIKQKQPPFSLPSSHMDLTHPILPKKNKSPEIMCYTSNKEGRFIKKNGLKPIWKT
jgi:hypothetical protein